jgi:CubicO group peptidase (beta-lactamase class C family)
MERKRSFLRSKEQRNAHAFFADRCRYVLEQPVVAPGGQVWNYNSGATLLLEAVIANAAGAALDDIAREFLLEPLGITDFEWTRNLKSGILEWGGLRLRSRDLTKIGQLVVNGGNWNGRRIVSQKWVKESTAAHMGPADLTYFYGYQWWLGRSWSRDARCRGSAQWDMVDSASSQYHRSIL